VVKTFLAYILRDCSLDTNLNQLNPLPPPIPISLRSI